MALFISTIVITGAAIVASIIHALVPRISINYVSMIIGVGIALIVPLNRLIRLSILKYLCTWLHR